MSQRDDVVQALRVLTDADAHQLWREGTETWPGMTDAVHWLIDDTWLDRRPPTDLVPMIFRSEGEATAVGAVSGALLRVLDDLDARFGQSDYSDRRDHRPPRLG